MKLKTFLFGFLLFSSVAKAGKDLVISGAIADQYSSNLSFESRVTFPYLKNTCTKGGMTSFENCNLPDNQCQTVWYQEGYDNCSGVISRTNITFQKSLESKISIELINATGLPDNQLDYQVLLVGRDRLHAALLQAGLDFSSLRLGQEHQVFLVLSSKKNLRLKPGTFATDLRPTFQFGDKIKVTAVLEKGRPTYKTYSVLGLPTVFPASVIKTYDLPISSLIGHFQKIFDKSQPIVDLNTKLGFPENSRSCHLISVDGIQKVSVGYQFMPSQARLLFSIDSKMVMSTDQYGPRNVHADWSLGIPILSTFKNLTGRPFQLQVKDEDLKMSVKGVEYIARRSPEGRLIMKSSADEFLSCELNSAAKGILPD